MSSQHIGIEEARGRLGDLVTAAQQGTDIILTRNRRPVARITRYQEGEHMSAVISLKPKSEQGGWVWEVNDDGVTRRYRTDSDGEGLWIWIEDGPSVSWKQLRGHLQAHYPASRDGMIRRLRQNGYDVSALQALRVTAEHVKALAATEVGEGVGRDEAVLVHDAGLDGEIVVVPASTAEQRGSTVLMTAGELYDMWGEDFTDDEAAQTAAEINEANGWRSA